MLEEFKEEEIVNKVGGRFKLSSLDPKTARGSQPRSTAAGGTAHEEHDGNRRSGNHAGQNLPGPFRADCESTKMPRSVWEPSKTTPAPVWMIFNPNE